MKKEERKNTKKKERVIFTKKKTEVIPLIIPYKRHLCQYILVEKFSRDFSKDSFRNFPGIFIGNSSGVCQEIYQKIRFETDSKFFSEIPSETFLGFLEGFYKKILQRLLQKFMLHVFLQTFFLGIPPSILTDFSKHTFRNFSKNSSRHFSRAFSRNFSKRLFKGAIPGEFFEMILPKISQTFSFNKAKFSRYFSRNYC